MNGTSSPIKHLGGWEGKANNTIYYADTDGTVQAFGHSISTSPLAILTDSANPPTTVRAETCDDGGVTAFSSVTSRVKKGDYWKTQNATTVFWVPEK